MRTFRVLRGNTITLPSIDGQAPGRVIRGDDIVSEDELPVSADQLVEEEVIEFIEGEIEDTPDPEPDWVPEEDPEEDDAPPPKNPPKKSGSGSKSSNKK